MGDTDRDGLLEVVTLLDADDGRHLGLFAYFGGEYRERLVTSESAPRPFVAARSLTGRPSRCSTQEPRPQVEQPSVQTTAYRWNGFGFTAVDRRRSRQCTRRRAIAAVTESLRVRGRRVTSAVKHGVRVSPSRVAARHDSGGVNHEAGCHSMRSSRSLLGGRLLARTRALACRRLRPRHRSTSPPRSGGHRQRPTPTTPAPSHRPARPAPSTSPISRSAAGRPGGHHQSRQGHLSDAQKQVLPGRASWRCHPRATGPGSSGTSTRRPLQGLPVLVTTDSLLNAYHGLFDTLLQRMEETLSSIRRSP